MTALPEAVVAEHKAVLSAFSPEKVRKSTAEDVGQTEAQVEPGPDRTQSEAVALLKLLWATAQTRKRINDELQSLS